MTREEDIKKAVETMRKGGVILYPTDTVWGIGCDATNVDAVKRVYAIKQRDDSKALICLVDSDARMQRYFRTVPDVAWQLVDSLKESDAKPTTLILDGAINLAEKNSAIGSRRPSCPPRRISAENLQRRTTATSILGFWKLWTMCVGTAGRNINPIPRRASSN